MEPHRDCMENREVYPVQIINKGKVYLTLFYYTAASDSILHNDKNILYFSSVEDMEAFCVGNHLQMAEELVAYDFDAPTANPVDYVRLLDNWNLLNTIATMFGMFFEGDCKKYDPLYDLLFRLNTPIKPIPPMYRMREKEYYSILKVFRKKDRFLDRFALYPEKQQG